MHNPLSGPIGRRNLLGARVAGSAAATLPASVRAPFAKVLRFVPLANLANLDPIWTTQYVVRNASLLLFDILYGVGHPLTPGPQMAEGHELSADQLTYTFKLTPGLKWHGGDTAWFGWPKSDDVQGKLGAWFADPDLNAEKAPIRDVNKAECDFATFLPTGFFKGYQAWRKSLAGIVQAPFPVVWDVKNV